MSIGTWSRTGRIQIIQRSFSLFSLTLKTNPTTFTAELLPQVSQASDWHLRESSGGPCVSYHPVSSVFSVNRVQATACLWKELWDPPHVSLRRKGHLKRCLYCPGGFANPTSFLFLLSFSYCLNTNFLLSFANTKSLRPCWVRTHLVSLPRQCL